MKVAVCRSVHARFALIKNGDVFRRRTGVHQNVITKMVHVLDEGLYPLRNLALTDPGALGPLAFNFIASQRFPQHSDKRPISRKENGVCRLILISTLSSDVQANQCLACSRHTGDKANKFSLVCSCFIDQLLNAAGGQVQILCPASERAIASTECWA